MTTIQKKTAVTALAAFSLLGTLAGCATATTASTDAGSSDTTADDTGTSSSSAAASTGSYTDGDYEASGSYQSPGGTETIDVSLTLAGNVVTAVTVTGKPSTPDATHYQSEFESGISAAVVGKNIDELSVDKVGGSSLTSGGFNTAVEQIKTDAAA